MARRCAISGKGNQNGNRVSHANNKTKHLFKPNLQIRRIYLPEEKRFVKLQLSTRMIRTLDKLGLDATLKKYNLKVADLV